MTEEAYEIASNMRHIISVSKRLIAVDQGQGRLPKNTAKPSRELVELILDTGKIILSYVYIDKVLRNLREQFRRERLEVREELERASSKYRHSGVMEARAYLEALSRNDVCNRISALALEEKQIRFELFSLLQEVLQVVFIDLPREVLGEKYNDD